MNQFNGAGKTDAKWVRLVLAHADDEDSAKLQEILAQKAHAKAYIIDKIEPVVSEAASIVGMKYTSDLSAASMTLCTTYQDVLKSWLQDSSEENQKKFAYVMYHYGGKLFATVNNGRSHAEIVEENYLRDHSITYTDLEALGGGRRSSTCMVKLYHKILTDKRSYILKNGLAKHGTRVTRRTETKEDLPSNRKKRGPYEYCVTEVKTVQCHGCLVAGAQIVYNVCPFCYIPVTPPLWCCCFSHLFD